MVRKLVLVVLVVVLLAGCGTQKGKCSMAVEFTYAGSGTLPSIAYGDVLPDGNKYSFVALLNFVSKSGSPQIYFFDWGTRIFDYSWSTGKLRFYQGFSTTQGVWQITWAPSLGVDYLLAITLDASSVANNPVISVDGVSLGALTETSTPVGTANNPSNGYLPLLNGTLTVRYFDYRIYNRVLSLAELLEITNLRSQSSVPYGLVFQPNFHGASGGVGDGSTLAAGNKVIDRIGGAGGTPQGSPILRADTVLCGQ